MSVFPDLEPGCVWLVGAGPGDPGLLSLLGLHALRQADFVIFDSAIEPELLGLIPVTAIGERVDRGHRDDTAAAAARRAIDLAMIGWRVVRLKVGDPFSSPDGIVEAAVLAEARVGLRIVPGIRPDLAGLSYAGIPTTHRDINSAFAVAHLPALAGGELGPDIIDLALSAPVLLATLDGELVPGLAQRLIEAGIAPGAAVALIARPGTRHQSVVETTLEACKTGASTPAAGQPLIFVLGPVVPLRHRLGIEPEDDRRSTRRHPAGFTMSGMG